MSVEISATSNPLRSPADRRLNRIAGPSALVIFGVTGDLSRKKLMPAVYDLSNRGLLPPGFGLVGFARREWDDEDFEREVHDAVKQHSRTPFNEDVWNQLKAGIRFVQGEFDDDAAYTKKPRVLPRGFFVRCGQSRAPRLRPAARSAWSLRLAAYSRAVERRCTRRGVLPVACFSANFRVCS